MSGSSLLRGYLPMQIREMQEGGSILLPWLRSHGLRGQAGCPCAVRWSPEKLARGQGIEPCALSFGGSIASLGHALVFEIGCRGGIRTHGCEVMSIAPYHLATLRFERFATVWKSGQLMDFITRV